MTTPRPRRILPLVLCLLAALAAAPRAQGAGQPTTALDLHSYAAALTRCAGEVAHLRAHPEQIAAFRKALPPAWNVRADGKSFAVSTAWLDSALGEIEAHPQKAAPVWRAIGQRLEFLSAQAEALEAPAATPSPGTARDRLDAIFRRSEFRGMAGPSALARWWRRVTDRIGDWIDWLISRLHLGAVTGNMVAYVLIGVAGGRPGVDGQGGHGRRERGREAEEDPRLRGGRERQSRGRREREGQVGVVLLRRRHAGRDRGDEQQQRADERVDHELRRRPHALVALENVRPDRALSVGANVAAGSSKLGRVADIARYENQALARFAPDRGNNVSIQVYPSASLGVR